MRCKVCKMVLKNESEILRNHAKVFHSEQIAASRAAKRSLDGTVGPLSQQEPQSHGVQGQKEDRNRLIHVDNEDDLNNVEPYTLNEGQNSPMDKSMQILDNNSYAEKNFVIAQNKCNECHVFVGNPQEISIHTEISHTVADEVAGVLVKESYS